MAVLVRTGLSALQAIDLSKRQEGIVHLAYTPQLAADLFSQCECHLASVGVLEYWGDGWRVYLHASPKASDREYSFHESPDLGGGYLVRSVGGR